MKVQKFIKSRANIVSDGNPKIRIGTNGILIEVVTLEYQEAKEHHIELIKKYSCSNKYSLVYKTLPNYLLREKDCFYYVILFCNNLKYLLLLPESNFLSCIEVI